jgi:hypothetical protein
MVIRLRTIIEEITKALNEDNLRVGDLLYYYNNKMDWENVWKIIDIIENEATIKLIGSIHIKPGRVGILKLPDDLKYYSKHSKLK